MRSFPPDAPAMNPMRADPGPERTRRGTTPMHAIRSFLHKKTAMCDALSVAAFRAVLVALENA